MSKPNDTGIGRKAGADHSAFSQVSRASLARPPNSSAGLSPSVDGGSMSESAASQLIEFRASGIHGRGGFASKAVPVGTQLIEYLGERISKEESRRRCEENNPFIFDLDDEVDLDGNVEWNPARWLNHSCEPNCAAEIDESRIWIAATRALRVGEELTFNYGYDLEDYRDFPCKCGKPCCVGFIVAEEFFEQVRRESCAEPAGRL